LPKAPPGTRIGLLGGSFDPPHLSHQLLALSALAIEPIDTLWVIPCADHPFQKSLSSFEHRMAMCELAFSHVDRQVRVVPIEKYLPSPNYTVRTLEHILERRPGVKLFLTMGSDILQQLPKWHEPEKLEQLSELIVYLREGFPIQNIPTQVQKLRIHDGYILPDIQSSNVRALIQKGTSEPKDDRIPFVDQKVAAYIKEHHLYRE
jgi:nicotinate-nucleotide adenylyltransferase